MPISKKIHFIWLGQLLPNNRLEHIKNWSNLNEEFQINLWLDEIGAESNSIFGTTYSTAVEKTKALINQHQIKNIEIKDIQEFNTTEEENYWQFIRYEIDKLRPNYGAASDLLRLIILEKHGGAYYDSDVNPISLSNLEPWNTEGLRLYMYQKNCNDIIICPSEEPTLVEWRKKVSLNQTIFDGKSFVQSMNDTYLSDNPFYIVSNTLRKTGPNTIILLANNQQEKIFELTNLRKTTHIESEQSWCNRRIKTLGDDNLIESLYNHLLKIISFEIQFLGILRLEDHVNSLLKSIQCDQKSNIIVEFMEKIGHVSMENVQYVQLTFEHEEVFNFYRQHNFLNKTCLLPWDLRVVEGPEPQPRKMLNVLSNLTNIVTHSPSNIHQFVLSLKRCFEDAETLRGKQYEKLERLKNPLQQGMINNCCCGEDLYYMKFAAEYIKQIGNNYNIQNMLTHLRKVVEARLNFLENYINCIKEDLKMEFLLEKLNMIKDTDFLLSQEISCLLRASKSEIAQFESKFEEQEEKDSIWEYDSDEKDNDPNFHKINSFMKNLTEPTRTSIKLVP